MSSTSSERVHLSAQEYDYLSPFLLNRSVWPTAPWARVNPELTPFPRDMHARIEIPVAQPVRLSGDDPLEMPRYEAVELTLRKLGSLIEPQFFTWDQLRSTEDGGIRVQANGVWIGRIRPETEAGENETGRAQSTSRP